MAIRIGTSGWVYSHWREIFYPAQLSQNNWFRYYADRFDTVEINNTFYRLPTTATFAKWRAQVPPGFLYAVKASRFLTHLKKLKDPEQPLQTFIEHAALLGETLGPILYQLPPRWRLNLPRFEDFLALLPKNSQHVIEFRDPSWLIDEVFQLMERYHVSHCIHDMTPPPRYIFACTADQTTAAAIHKPNWNAWPTASKSGIIRGWMSLSISITITTGLRSATPRL
jgi:uncharacterized protein YecE (DUF72 family)